MGVPRKDEYQARAAECGQRAAQIDDDAQKASWLKLERSWRHLADGTEANRSP